MTDRVAMSSRATGSQAGGRVRSFSRILRVTQPNRADAIALVLLPSEAAQTLPLWLRGFVQASATRETDWGQVMAASSLVAVPVIIFFLIVQGRLTSGLVAGAVKG